MSENRTDTLTLYSGLSRDKPNAVEPCEETEGGVHCGHVDPGAAALSWGYGGECRVVCCECGAQRQVGWSTVSVPVEGHGPHLHREVPRYAWPEHWQGGEE